MRILIVLLVFFTSKNFAQETGFKNLLRLFTGNNTEVPHELAFQYFDFVPTENKGALIADDIVLKTDAFIMLSIHFQCPEGVFCDQSVLSSFSSIGEPLERITFEQRIADCSFDDSRTVVLISKEMLVFKEVRKKLDCLAGGSELNTKNWLEFQPVRENGTFGKSFAKKSGMYREHYMSSYRVFDITELGLKTEAELAIIKNEIFASHGHIFKTAKWSAYFAAKPWYKPIIEDASEKLSKIEKQNIALILSIFSKMDDNKF